MTTYYVQVAHLCVDMGDHTDRYVRGDELAIVPAGSLESMLRLRQIGETPPGTVTVEPPGDPRQAAIGELDISDKAKQALLAAGLNTVADVLAYGEQNAGLTEIEGVGEATEESIKAAIESLLSQ